MNTDTSIVKRNGPQELFCDPLFVFSVYSLFKDFFRKTHGSDFKSDPKYGRILKIVIRA